MFMANDICTERIFLLENPHSLINKDPFNATNSSLTRSYSLNRCVRRTCPVRAAFALRNINSRVPRGRRGFRMERLAIVLQALVKDAGEEDGRCGTEELKGCVCHPTIEQDFLADARVELECRDIWELDTLVALVAVELFVKDFIKEGKHCHQTYFCRQVVM